MTREDRITNFCNEWAKNGQEEMRMRGDLNAIIKEEIRKDRDRWERIEEALEEKGE
jgi:hypothetical protein